MSDGNFWGIHSDKLEVHDGLFVERNVVAIGWKELGNLALLGADREAFKGAFQKALPGSKAGAVPVQAGQLYRFVHEMKVGDLIAYPSRTDRQIHFGRVQGEYSFDGAIVGTRYPHTRAVRWMKTAPRTHFSQGALYEVGSVMTLFMIKNYVDEFRSFVEGMGMRAIHRWRVREGGVAERTLVGTTDRIGRASGTLIGREARMWRQEIA